MLKIIAILVLSSNLSVAVETNDGWKEKAFPNTPTGAAELIGYAERTLGEAEDGVRIVLGCENDDDNSDHILDELAKNNIKHGLVFASDVLAAKQKYGTPPASALSVAMADLDKFGLIYRQKVIK